jgi:hypothetical protein
MLRRERWELSAEQDACVAELVSITFITEAPLYSSGSRSACAGWTLLSAAFDFDLTLQRQPNPPTTSKAADKSVRSKNKSNLRSGAYLIQ